MKDISEHITFRDATRSEVAIKNGIENIPDEFQVKNMEELAEAIYEPLIKHFNCKIYISSFFRSIKLNEKISGSSKVSQHCAIKGAAFDLDVFGNITNKQIFEFIRLNLEFDQLIYEFGTDENPDWVHISFNRGFNRKEVKRSFRTKDGIVYKLVA